MTQAISGSGDFGSAVSAFARAASAPASRSSLVGEAIAVSASTAQRLGAFLASAAAGGVDEAGANLGITSLASMTPAEALFALADALSDNDGSLAAAVAYSALADTMSELVDGSSTGDLLEWLATPEGTVHLIETFIANTLQCLLMSELGDRLEASSASVSQIISQTDEIRRFIRAHVSFTLQGLDVISVDWLGNQGAEIIQAAFDDALQVLRA